MTSALSDIRLHDALEHPETENRADAAIWLLVSGAPRSGTTLMAQILNTHPQIGCLHEYGLERVVDNVANFFGVDPNAHLDLAAATANMVEEASFDGFSNERDRFVKKHAGSVFLYPRLSQHCDALRKSVFEVVSGKKNLRVLADKTPNKQDLRSSDQLRNRLGNLKHLYVVRHPIAVIASSMSRARGTELGTDKWHIKTIYEALAEWLDNWEYLSRSLVDAEDALFLRYEDLFVDFDLEMKKLALFLDVEPQFANICKQTPDKFVDFHLTRHQVAELESHLGEIVMAWRQSAIVDTLVKFPRIFCVIDADREFVIGGNPLARLVLRQGFGAIEAWGAWTHGHKAEIRFKIEGLRKDAELYVELGFNPLMAGREYFEFIVRINSAPAEVRRLRPPPPNQHAIRTGFLCKPLNGNVSIELFIANPKTIDEAPAGDHRPMGMGLTSIKPSLL